MTLKPITRTSWEVYGDNAVLLGYVRRAPCEPGEAEAFVPRPAGGTDLPGQATVELAAQALVAQVVDRFSLLEID